VIVVVDPTLLASFVLTATAIVVSPGPDTLVIVRHALGSGRTAGLAAVAGVQIGLLVHATLAAAGISAIIAASPPLFHTLALAGAGYLAWLGWRALAGASRLSMVTAAPLTRPVIATREALLTNLLNPKVLVLFFALYPNFIVAHAGSVPAQVAQLTAVLIIVNGLWQTALAWFADRARQSLLRPAIAGWLNRGVGIALLIFAALLIIEHVL
jgi:threonine/homoserine/homoserine lactone efflux protein